MAERKRIAVPISGIDTSTPDHSVADGKCEDLNNLRFTGDAWRNVKGFEKSLLSAITSADYDSIDIVYKHPADVDNTYICEAIKGEKKYLLRANYSTGDNTWTLSQFAELDGLSYKYNHFGKIFSVGDNQKKAFTFFILDNSTYQPFSIGSNPISLTYDLGKSVVSKNWNSVGNGDSMVETIYTNTTNEETLTRVQGTHWRGEIGVFATIELSSGEVLCASSPVIINTAQTDIDSYEQWFEQVKLEEPTYGTTYFNYPVVILYNNNSNETSGITASYSAFGIGGWKNNPNSKGDVIKNGFPCARLYMPKITITLTRSNELKALSDYNDLRVRVWATRLYPLFNIDKMIDEAQAIQPDAPKNIYAFELCKWFDNTDIFNETFYQFKDIDFSNFNIDNENKEHKVVVTIKADDLENIVHSIRYRAAQSYTGVYSEGVKDYNNRWHLYDTVDLLNGNNQLNLKSGYDYEFAVIKSRNNNYAKVNQKIANEQLSPILIAPFYAAKLMFVNKSGVYYSFKMKQSTSLAICVFVNRTADVINTLDNKIGSKPYINIVVRNHASESGEWDEDSIRYKYFEEQANRLWVSDLNTNLTYDYGNAYRIGSEDNKIMAINSAAIEMSDAKFGEFPLYVFTKEGIFAMQSGKDTLYSAVIPINYDVVINPNTLAVNGAVLYFTNKGLHALTNQGAKLLSQPIHTEENRIPNWMRSCQMVYLPEWNEVLCTDLPNSKAYVFSLDNNVWSTRNIPEGYILNNDELVAKDNNLYNLRNEEESLSDSMPYTLTTRPIKLGSMELKRAETIIVRFESPDEQTLNVSVEGSIDTQNWKTLRKLEGVQTNKDILIRRTPCSVKYLRFTISGEATSDIRILAFELEYYNKWIRKMR